MWILLISLVIACHRGNDCRIHPQQKAAKKIDAGELESFPEVKEVDAECCGQHEVCEKTARWLL